METPEQQWKRRKRAGILRQTCPAKSCQAVKGEPCKSRNGAYVTWFHVGRQDKWFKEQSIMRPADG